VTCVFNLQYKLGRGSREEVQQFMTITGARYGCLIPFELDLGPCLVGLLHKRALPKEPEEPFLFLTSPPYRALNPTQRESKTKME
jgi:hypothetical protein